MKKVIRGMALVVLAWGQTGLIEPFAAAQPAKGEQIAADAAAKGEALAEQAKPAKAWTPARLNASETLWSTVTSSTNPATGLVDQKTNTFTALAGGLNYKNEKGEWTESREEIELFEGGAIARQAGHKVVFAQNINTKAAIQLTMPNGQVLKSHVIGLAFTDAATGQSVLIAEVRDSVGAVKDNIVLYSDAFDADGFTADLKYTFSKDGLEQDVVIREKPPKPSDYGLSDKTSRLEIWTEFVDAPVPDKTTRQLKGDPAAVNPQAALDPGLSDETILFADMTIGDGTAFPLNSDPDKMDASPVHVGKEWAVLDAGRTFLIEKTDFSDVVAELEKLPKLGAAQPLPLDPKQAARAPRPRQQMLAATTQPPERDKREVRADAQARPADRKMEMAAAFPSRPGYVLDYVINLTATFLTSYRFLSGQTYLILGSVTVNSTLAAPAVIEGGAVIKYTNGIDNRIRFTGPVSCQTRPGLPAYFVGLDDNSLGELIPNSTGNPGQTKYAFRAVDFDQPSGSWDMHDLRFRNCKTAIAVTTGSLKLRHAQITYCSQGLLAVNGVSTAWLLNALLVDISGNAINQAGGSKVYGQHLTIHRAGTLRSAGPGPSAELILTNCLLAAVTNSSGPNGYTLGIMVSQPSSDLGLFATAGSGAHYLPSGSNLRKSGDLKIDPQLSHELRRTSTQVPLIRTGTITANTELGPTAERNMSDANLPYPDIGFAYDAIDHLVRTVTIQGTSANTVKLSIVNGAVVALDPGSSAFGISCGTYSELESLGPTFAPNQFVALQCIQENRIPLASGNFSLITRSVSTPYSKATLRSTDLFVPAGPMRHFAQAGSPFVNLELTGCRFYGGEVYLSSGTSSYLIGVTNCLFNVSIFNLRPSGAPTFYMRNNHFERGKLDLSSAPVNYAGSIRDNFFDEASILHAASLTGVEHSYNGYVQGFATLNGASSLTSYFLSSAQRDTVFPSRGVEFYQSPDPGQNPLLNHGSRKSHEASMWTNCVAVDRRDRDQVDIGFHYPFDVSPVVFAGDAIDTSLDPGSGTQTVRLRGMSTSRAVGKIFVAHDDWILSSRAFLMSGNSREFALRYVRAVLDWFMGNAPNSPQTRVAGKFLVYSSASGLTAPELPGELSEHEWLISTALPFNIQTLCDYDGVILGGPIAINSQTIKTVLKEYLQLGGNVYIAGGTESDSQQGLAASQWNTFLSDFKLQFGTVHETSLNPNLVSTLINGSTIYEPFPSSVSSTHPLLSGVTRLLQWKGNAISRLTSTDFNTDIVASDGALGLFGIYVPMTRSWSHVSGPAIAEFSATQSPDTYATFIAPGTYKLAYSAGGGVSEVTVRVNGPPSVLAKAQGTAEQATVTLVDSTIAANLTGVVSDPDGLPVGAMLKGAWSVVFDEPGFSQDPVAITPQTGFTATATFRRVGTYRLRLSVSDSLLESHSDVTVTVNKASNLLPVVSAGPNQTIVSPNHVFLPGVVSDDGWPSGSHLSFLWTGTGPGAIKFSHSSSTNTYAYIDVPGTYTLTLTAREVDANSQVLSATSASAIVTVNDPTLPTADERFYQVKVFTGGVGGMRGAWPEVNPKGQPGSGSIVLDGISGRVRRAYLIWHGPHDLESPTPNGSVLVNGRLVTGLSRGKAFDDNWTYGRGRHSFQGSETYQADITDLVRSFGSGPYALNGFAKGEEVEVNGASIIAFTDAPSDGKDMILWVGNDSNGSLTFYPDGEVTTLGIGPGDKLFLGGDFYSANAPGRSGIARLALSTGAFDPAFAPKDELLNLASGGGLLALSKVHAVVPWSGGGVLLAGTFTKVNGIARQRIARLSSIGLLENNFDLAINGPIYCMLKVTIGAQDKILIGGDFSSVSGAARSKLALLDATSGTLDTTFVDPQLNGAVYCLATTGSGSNLRFIVGGEFTQVGSAAQKGLAAFNQTGAHVSPGNPDFEGAVRAICVQASGKLVVGGDFVKVGSTIRDGIVRLTSMTPTPGWTVDGTFATVVQGGIPDPTPGSQLTLGFPSVFAIEQDSSGRLVIGGRFVQVGGVPRGRIARLDVNGNLDPTFVVAKGPSTVLRVENRDFYDATLVSDIAIDQSGNILVAGNFVSWEGGGFVRGLCRLAPTDGKCDATYPPAREGHGISLAQVLSKQNADLSVQLHVSDGQPGFDSALGWADVREADILVQHGTAAETIVFPSQLSQYASPTEPFDPQQYLFSGLTVPTWAWSRSYGSLWDVTDYRSAFPTQVGSKTLTISAGPFPPGVIDYVTIVAAVVKMPPENPIPAWWNTALPPADFGPSLVNDSFTVRRVIGRQVLNVLANDKSERGVLRISRVSQPTSGSARCEIVYDGSAILFTGDQSDSFTYTATDLDGNEAMATVDVVVQGPTPGSLTIGSAPLSGSLQTGDELSFVRGGGRKADFYQVGLTAGESIAIDVSSAELSAHAYLLNPNGELVASGSHAPRDAMLVYTAKSSGLYVVEVTGHLASELGTYGIQIGLNPTAKAVEVSINEALVRQSNDFLNTSALDLGLLKGEYVFPIQIKNTGGHDLDELELQLSCQTGACKVCGGVWDLDSTCTTPSVTISPTRIVGLRKGESISGTLHLFAPAPLSGSQSQTHVRIDVAEKGSNPSTIFTGWMQWDLLPPNSFDGQFISPLNGLVISGITNLPIQVLIPPITSYGDPVPVTDVNVYSLSVPGGWTHVSSTFTSIDPYPPSNAKLYTAIWQNPPLGTHDLMVVVGASSGRSVFGPHRIYRVNPSLNHSPMAVEDSVQISLNSGPITIDALANDYDLDGDVLTIVQASIPSSGTVSIQGGSKLIYAPPANSYGSDYITYQIADGRGGKATAVVNVNIINEFITINEPSENANFAANVTIELQSSAETSVGAIEHVVYYANGIKVAQGFDRTSAYVAEWRPPAVAKRYTLTAAAISSAGRTNFSAPIKITVGNPSGSQSLTAIIANVKENQIIRDGLFSVTGTAKGVNNTADNHSLRVYRSSAPNVPVVDMSNTGPDNSGYLGDVDLTMLRNGTYILELEVVQGANLASTQVPFVLDSQMKVGQLTFSQEDLVVAGDDLPIRIVRTYDSLNPDAGDFGTSWTMAINSLDVELDDVRGNVPIESGSTETLEIRLGGGRDVTLTLPDGRRTTFVHSLVPGPSDDGVPCYCFKSRWTPPPDVDATLNEFDDSTLQFLPYQSIIQPFWQTPGQESGLGIPLENYDFRGFILTNEDGTRFTISRRPQGEVDLEPDGSLLQFAKSFSKPKLTQILRRNGERIDIGDNSITHTRPTGTASRSIYFARDPANNRVTAIYAPEAVDQNTGLPTGLATIEYSYTPYTIGPGLTTTYLSGVKRLTMQSSGSSTYTYTRFKYEKMSGYPKPVLTQIQTDDDDIEANGFVSVFNTFDANGRFIGGQDSIGTSIAVTHDIVNRREVITDPTGHIAIHEYDSRGNVVRSIDQLGHVTTRSYDLKNSVISEVDPLGNRTLHEYDARGNLTKTVDALNNITTWTYDHFGNLLNSTEPTQNILDPTKWSTGYGYDPNSGQLLRSTNATRAFMNYTYVNGMVETVTDYQGTRTTYEYYAANDPSGSRKGDLKGEKVEEFKNGQWTALKYATYSYDVNGNRVGETNISSTSLKTLATKFVHDKLGRLTRTVVDPDDPTATPPYVGRNLMTVTSYDSFGRTYSTTDPLSRTTTRKFDRRGNVVEINYPTIGNGVDSVDPTLSRMVYDEAGRVIYRQDQFKHDLDFPDTANGTRHVYDDAGRSLRTERLIDITITIAADDPGQTPARFYKTAFVGAGPRTAPTSPRGDPLVSASITGYDAAGRVVRAIDARGSVTAFGYDEAGRRTFMTNALGFVTRYKFDPNGNQTGMTDALGRVTDYYHDKLNRLVVTKYPAVPNVANLSERYLSQTLYDDLGRKIAETNQAGIVTRMIYNGLGRLLSVTTDADTPGGAAITRYGYDDVGNMIWQQDANQEGKPTPLRTLFDFNRLGQRISRTLPEGPSETFIYDDAGNVKSHTSFKNGVTEFKYDALNRLRRKHAQGAEATPFVEFSYSADGKRTNAVTDRTSATEFGSRYGYYYHQNERLTNVHVEVPGMPGFPYRDLRYWFDSNGNLLKLWNGEEQNDTFQAYFTWDPLNRLSSVTDRQIDSLNTSGYVTSYEYDLVGNVAKVTYPGSVQTSHNFNGNNQLTDMLITAPSGNLASFNYSPSGPRTLDPVGARRTAVESINGQTRTVEYDYDNRRRLTKESFPATGGYRSYEALTSQSSTTGYDAVGNRRSLRIKPTSASAEAITFATFDANDRLLKRGASVTGPDRYVYDDNGNTTSDLGADSGNTDDLRDTYNFENRLIHRAIGPVGSPTKTINLTYDADGNRVKKVVWELANQQTTTTFYLVDNHNPSGYFQVIEEDVAVVTPGLGNKYRYFDYVYGLDLISQRLECVNEAPVLQRSFYGCDGHGSVRFLLEPNGNITDTYNYDAFGVLLEQAPSVGGTRNHYLYAGEQFDEDLEMYFNRARYLHPEIGRFWTMDTFEGNQSDPLSLHKYLYASANPVNRIDPSGHESLVELQSVQAIQNILTVTRTTTSVLRTINKVKSWYDFLDTIREIGGLLNGGEITQQLKNHVKDKFIGDIAKLDMDAAVDSLLRNTSTLISSGMLNWGTYIGSRYSQVDRFVVYLPNISGIPYFEIKGPKLRNSDIKVNLALGAGSEENRSYLNKVGRVTGVGVGFRGETYANQIWRMDYHEMHQGGSDLAQWPDWPFHYHVIRPPR